MIDVEDLTKTELIEEFNKLKRELENRNIPVSHVINGWVV